MKFNNKIFLFVVAFLALAVFIGAVGYNVVYNDTNNFALFGFNQTNLTQNFGISLLWNGNATAGYNFTQGDFSSFVFYNSSATFWNLTLGIADTYSSRSGIVTSSGINISDPNLVAYWGLDGLGNGTFFPDGTGKYNATCPVIGGTCPTNNTGLSSPALKFAGAATGITTTLPQIKGNVTHSVWINYPVADIGDYNWLIGVQATTWDRLITETGTGKILFDFKVATVYTSITSNRVVIDGTWHHIIATRNDTKCTIYVDGILDNTAACSSADSELGINYTIGYENNGGTPYYVPSGKIDEVLVYNKSLSAAEVNAIYKSGLSSKFNTNITLQTRTANNYNISDANLQVLYGFNNDNATSAFDETGKFNATRLGALLNASAENGTVGKGYYFDGVNDGFVTNVSIYNSLSNGYTYSAWINPADVSAFQLLLSNFVINYSMEIRLAGTSEMSAVFYCIDNTNYIYSATASTPLKNNQWQFVTYTWNGTINRNGFSFYVNGVQIPSTFPLSDTCTGTPFTGTNSPAPNIGVRKDGTTGPYKGKIDEVRIYNRSLNVTEITNLYQLGNYHLNWGSWSSATTAQDNVATKIGSNGKFMQFKTNFYTNNSASSPYLLNHSVASFDFL